MSYGFAGPLFAAIAVAFFGASIMSEGDMLQYGALGVLSMLILLAYRIVDKGIGRIAAISDECHAQAAKREERIMVFMERNHEALREFMHEERSAIEKVIDRCPYRSKGG